MDHQHIVAQLEETAADAAHDLQRKLITDCVEFGIICVGHKGNGMRLAQAQAASGLVQAEVVLTGDCLDAIACFLFDQWVII
ncbi:hypothetical protein SDC9_177828 [bioreactor metagenome]|uniref:Uncharacterized protein n=1 Tax=bioreactor metagenome TaxID=1076179 RepID=A0A645GUC6_9ZZZZ